VKNFPGSTWIRFCQMQALTTQKKPATEILPVVEDILKLDPNPGQTHRVLV